MRVSKSPWVETEKAEWDGLPKRMTFQSSESDTRDRVIIEAAKTVCQRGQGGGRRLSGLAGAEERCNGAPHMALGDRATLRPVKKSRRFVRLQAGHEGEST